MESNYYNSPKTKLGLIKFFILILIIEVSFICYNQYQEIYNTDITQRTLIVSIQKTDATDEEFSDSTQINNAIKDGGMIFIYLDSDWLDDNFDPLYKAYGANDSDDMFYVLGGVLNYISSKGWTLVQAPTSGLNNTYYFTKDIVVKTEF